MHSSINASTSRTNAFPNSNSPTLAMQRLHVTVIARGVATPRPRRCPAVLHGVPVPGRQRGHAAPAIRLAPMGHGAHAHAELPGGLLLPHAAQYRFDRLLPGFQGDDGGSSMPGMTEILRQPAFQALPGRITEVFDHFGVRR